MNHRVDATEAFGPSAVQRGTLAVVVITMAGAMLRLYRLDSAELWTDELTGVIWSGWSIGHYLHMMYAATWLHFPFTAWMVKALVGIFGDGVLVYRLVGFIPGTLAIPALYCMGKRLFSRQIGLVAAALLAFSPTAVFVSQEAWDYGLVLLSVIVCAYAFFAAWQADRWAYWWLFGLCGLFCFYVHIFNVLIIASLYLAYAVGLLFPGGRNLAWQARCRSAVAPVVIGVILGILFIPGILIVFRTAGQDVAPESGLVGAGPVISFWDSFLVTLRHFAYDRPASIYLLGALFLLSIAVAVKRPRQWLFVVFATLCIAAPIGWAYSKGIQFRIRQYTFALPFAVTIMACGIITLRQICGLFIRRWRQWDTPLILPDLCVAAAIMFLPCVAALNQYYMIRAPQSALLAYRLDGLVEKRLVDAPTKIQLYSKSVVPEYREIAAIIQRNVVPGDMLILDPIDTRPNDTARNLVLILNRIFKFSIPVDEWGTPLTASYDPGRLNVMASIPTDSDLDVLKKAPLPPSGVRVFRASQQYPIGEVSGALALTFTLISLAVSEQRFTDADRLIEYLAMNRDLSRAGDLASAAEESMNKGADAEAEAGFRASLAVYKTSKAAYGLGALLLKQKKLEEALPLLVFAAKARGNRWDYWMRAGKAYEALGKGDEAIQSYETAAVLPNATPWVRLDLAKLYELKKDFASAHQAYEWLAGELKDPGYQVAAIRMLLQDNRAEDALREALELVAKYPGHGGANLVAAMAYERLGDKQDAYGYLVRAADLRPDDISVQAACADYQIARGEFGLAEARLRSALEKHPGDVTLEGLLAKVRRAAGNE